MADFVAYNYRAERVDPTHMKVFVEVPVEARGEDEAIQKVKNMVESAEYRKAESDYKAEEEARFARENRAAAEEPSKAEQVKTNVKKALDKDTK